MTNQVNQAFEKWWHSSKYMQVVFSDNRTKRVALDGYEASSQASESEINSLKERVKELEADLELLKPHPKCDMGCMLVCNMEGNAIRELQADNNQLREELEKTLTSLEERKI